MYKNITGTNDATASVSTHLFWSDASNELSIANDLRRKRQWRASPEDVAKFREFVKKFEGTHNFHNFTVGRDFKDKSCIRFMKTIEVRNRISVFSS